MRRQWIIMSQLLLLIIVSPFIGMARAGAIPADIAAKAQAEGTVRIIVQLDVPTRPEGTLASPLAVSTQRQAITAGQAAVLADLTGTNHRVARQFATIPFLALEVGPDALAALEQSSTVVGVTEDGLAAPSLAESVPLVEADQAWAAGFDGTGWSVAVLDTGVDGVHPFLAGKVVEEACFSGNSNCPDGSTTQIGPGAGVPCDYAPNGCRHGTHVAGIAAGQGDSFSGVAKGAGVIAIQVFSRFTGANCAGAGEDPCALSFTSDQIAALEHVLNLSATGQIASANMSLGGGRFFTQAACDAANSAQKAAIDNLRPVGIATAIASGNNGFTDSMSAPGCISTAVSIGSTTKTDEVSVFSNAAPFGPSLLAPGSSINSSVPGGGFAVFNGTSMATPHVAGAWAILKQNSPTATVDTVLSALRTTGLPVFDPGNGLTYPRIRIFQALNPPVQITIFQDDMESGPGSWVAQPPWDLTTEAAQSPITSWTDSPGGNYSNNANVSLFSPSLDFSGFSSVILKFWHRYDLESGFDFGNVWVTTDEGATFTLLASFTGTNTTWTEATINLSAFAGQPSVRFLFQLLTDGSITMDGWYIDDVLVTGVPGASVGKVTGIGPD